MFGFAATLLALGIRIPRPDDPDMARGLATLIVAEWPHYFAYALSFITIGIIWANHHEMFRYVARIDRGLVALNLVGLMIVAFLPVPTGVLGAWLANDAERRVAVLFYAGTLAVLGVFVEAGWWYAAYRARLVSPQLSARERRTLTLTWAGGPLFYALMMLIALVDPRWSVAGFVVIHVLYVLPTARLVAAAQRARS